MSYQPAPLNIDQTIDALERWRLDNAMLRVASVIDSGKTNMIFPLGHRMTGFVSR